MKRLPGKAREVVQRQSREKDVRSPLGFPTAFIFRVPSYLAASNLMPSGRRTWLGWKKHCNRSVPGKKLCVYRVALAQWQFFRLTRHVSAITEKAVLHPENSFTSSYDEDFVHACDVGEVLRRSESSLEKEFSRMRDFMKRVNALGGRDTSDITFMAAERRQILSAIAKQPTYNAGGVPVKTKIPAELLAELDAAAAESGDLEDDNSEDGNAIFLRPDGEDANDETVDNEDPVVVSGSQLWEEISEIAQFKGVEATEAIEELVDTLALGIKKRRRQLAVARTHIGMNLIPLDEKTVARLALYERQLDAVSRRYMNDLVRSQLARSGQAVPPPIALDLNLTGNAPNGD